MHGMRVKLATFAGRTPTVDIGSVPARASVYVDGYYVGTTPVEVTLRQDLPRIPGSRLWETSILDVLGSLPVAHSYRVRYGAANDAIDCPVANKRRLEIPSIGRDHEPLG